MDNEPVHDAHPYSILTSLVSILDHAVKIVPAAAYFWGVVATSITVAIISLLNGLNRITFVAMIAALIALFIFFVFSRIEKSTDVVIRLVGHVLVVVAGFAFVFVIFTSAWLAVTCKPVLFAYLYGVTEVCYASPQPAKTIGMADDYKTVILDRVNLISQHRSKVMLTLSEIREKLKAGESLLIPPGQYTFVNDLNNQLTDLWIIIAGAGLGNDPYLDRIDVVEFGSRTPKLVSNFGFSNVPVEMGIPGLFKRYISLKREDNIL